MSIWIVLVGCTLLGILLLMTAAYINVSTECGLQRKEIEKLRNDNEKLESQLAKRAWGEYE